MGEAMFTHYDMKQLPERELTHEDALEILDAGAYAVVSTVDPDGAPYGVPLSYVMIDGRMYIHTGKSVGHKIQDFRLNPRVSIAVATEVEPCYEETFFTTRYASVIAQGIISKVEDKVLAKRVLVELCMKYMPSEKSEI